MDLTSVPFEQINTLRPGFTNFCLKNGVDPGTEPLQTAPSVHTCLGGVSVDDKLLAKSNLYVVGEAIGGTHGANRLSSNSLTEANVTGWFAAQSAAHALLEDRRKNVETSVNAEEIISQIWNSYLPKEKAPGSNCATAYQLTEDLREVMGQSAGVERSHTGISQGLKNLYELTKAHSQLGFTGIDNMESWLDLRNMIETSQTILHCALVRRESRGAHMRTDFPDQNDNQWLGNIFIARKTRQEKISSEYVSKFVPTKFPNS